MASRPLLKKVVAAATRGDGCQRIAAASDGDAALDAEAAYRVGVAAMVMTLVTALGLGSTAMSAARARIDVGAAPLVGAPAGASRLAALPHTACARHALTPRRRALRTAWSRPYWRSSAIRGPTRGSAPTATLGAASTALHERLRALSRVQVPRQLFNTS